MARILLDGRTRHAEWKDGAKDGYPVVRISYRPALPKRVMAYIDARTDPVKRHDLTVDLLADHLVDWDITQDDPHAPGKEIQAPLTKETLAACPYPLLNWLTDVVCGYVAGRVAEEKN